MRDTASGRGFLTPTDIDHRAWLWVASLLSLVYSLLCLIARFTAKWGLLWYDDGILAAAYASAIVHWGLIFEAISAGLGASGLALSPSALTSASRLYFGARIPFFLAHCLSKLSILVFTRRIFAGDIYKEGLFFGMAYGVAIIYGLLAVLLSSAGCRPTDALIAQTNAVCDSNVGRWTAITALDGLTEVLILIMPIWFISKNQLKASKKRIVIFVYSFRLAVLGFTIATTVSYFNFLRGGPNSIGLSPTVAWQEALLALSLISASFPCLRSFLFAFMSRGLMTMYGNTTWTSSNQASRGASVALQTLHNNSHSQQHNLYTSNSKSQPSRKGSETGESRFRLRPEQVEYTVDVRSSSREDREAKWSEEEDRMFIQQETSFRVESIRTPL